MAGNKSKVLLTKEGVKKLTDELRDREGKLRKKLQDILNQMMSQGDLSENDGYSIALEDFLGNERRVSEIKDTLEGAEVVAKKKSSVVEIGCVVTIECGGKDSRTYTIVGEHEADPLKLKVSYKSPIGSSLLGKKKGEKVTIETPGGQTDCTIVSIE